MEAILNSYLSYQFQSIISQISNVHKQDSIFEFTDSKNI